MFEHSPLTREEESGLVWGRFWTASRGEQVIDCELIVPGPGRGQPILRCGYGPQSVIRSQVITSPEAAAEVAETWKAALQQQGFRVVPRPVLGRI